MKRFGQLKKFSATAYVLRYCTEKWLVVTYNKYFMVRRPTRGGSGSPAVRPTGNKVGAYTKDGNGRFAVPIITSLGIQDGLKNLFFVGKILHA